MQYASEDLKNEHEGILRGLKILEAISERVTRTASPPAADVSAVVDFLKRFADKCHHGKEEGLLFPAMEKAGIARENGPIGQMLEEHAAGRAHLARMAGAIGPDGVRADEFGRAAADYVALLRAHIEKENKVLFPLGDKLIPLSEQARLLAAFERHEEDVMGPGTHERLHGMLAEFEKKYLSGK